MTGRLRSEDIVLDGRAERIRTVLRKDRDDALRDRRDYYVGETSQAIADLNDLLIGIVEDVACFAPGHVEERVLDRIAAADKRWEL